MSTWTDREQFFATKTTVPTVHWAKTRTFVIYYNMFVKSFENHERLGRLFGISLHKNEIFLEQAKCLPTVVNIPYWSNFKFNIIGSFWICNIVTLLTFDISTIVLAYFIKQQIIVQIEWLPEIRQFRSHGIHFNAKILYFINLVLLCKTLLEF